MTGPSKFRRLHDYLLDNASGLFGTLPPDNPYLSLEAAMAHSAADEASL